MEEIWHQLQASIRGNMGRNAMFGEHMKKKQISRLKKVDLTYFLFFLFLFLFLIYFSILYF